MVAGEVRRQVVDVDQNAGLVLRVPSASTTHAAARGKGTHAGVDPRDGYERARRAAAAVHDVELRTADVELRAAERLGDVQRDLLCAHEVLAARERGGERERELLLACGQCEYAGRRGEGRDGLSEGKTSWPSVKVGDCW